MTLDLYYTPFSSPCRAVMLTAEAIGISLNLMNVDLLKGENKQPEFEKLNPQKSIPLLIDGDYKLSERAIMTYLANKYENKGRLYPTNPASRAIVNQRLYFDMDILYKSISDYYYPVIFGEKKMYDPVKYDNLKKAFQILDQLLENQDYVTGRNITLGDLAIVVSVSTADALNFDYNKYRHVTQWYEKMKRSAPGYRKANGDGAEMMEQFLKNQEA